MHYAVLGRRGFHPLLKPLRNWIVFRSFLIHTKQVECSAFLWRDIQAVLETSSLSSRLLQQRFPMMESKSVKVFMLPTLSRCAR